MRKFPGRTSAFSLTEIALAVGIVAFGLITALGLLPAGLNAMRYGRDELAAAHCLRLLSDSVRSATRVGTNRPAEFVGGGLLTNLHWTEGQAGPVTVSLTNLTASGYPAVRPQDAQLNARIELVPPGNGRTTVAALITVAWPVQADWSGTVWNNQQGHLSTHLILLPR